QPVLTNVLMQPVAPAPVNSVIPRPQPIIKNPHPVPPALQPIVKNSYFVRPKTKLQPKIATPHHPMPSTTKLP
ncbi:hypothetical protein ACP6PL_10450, partial [Dapis sp. BLCC M126]|uniref:hypothetical protein n=1 Tax=Dapis sp. BLCC M126 TaxID=3400189 RepID=UPI003CEA73CA